MIDRRTAKRPKTGSTVDAEEDQPDERRDADREPEEHLPAEPLAEDPSAEPADRP